MTPLSIGCPAEDSSTASTGGLSEQIPVVWRVRPRPSHRRDEPVLADQNEGGVDRAVLFLRAAGNDRRAGLEVGLGAGLEGDDRRLRIDNDGLLAAFVGHRELGAG